MSGHPRKEGQFAPEYSDEEFLDAVGEHAPAGTGEIAEVIGCTRQNADYRLRRLGEEDKVTSKKIGNSLAWSLAEEE